MCVQYSKISLDIDYMNIKNNISRIIILGTYSCISFLAVSVSNTVSQVFFWRMYFFNMILLFRIVDTFNWLFSLDHIIFNIENILSTDANL
jgi:hypothetical protein